MKTTKTALQLYNSILIFTLISTGFLTQSYNDLAPILLLIPVWIYFVVSTVDQIINFEHLAKNKNVANLTKIVRMLKIYSLIIVVLIISASFIYSSNIFESALTIAFLPLLGSFFIDIFNKTNYSKFKVQNIINLSKIIKSNKKEVTKANKKHKINEKLAKEEKSTKKRINKHRKNSKRKPNLDILLEGEPIEEISLSETASQISKADTINSKSKDEDILLKTDSLKLEKDNEPILNVQDHKRRQFLKIVGGGGVSMFLMLFVFQQKASAAFFGSGGGPGVVAVKDTSGTKIDPAEKQPTDGYNIAELDDDTSPSYYGFTHKNGNWYIAKEDSSGSYRYTNGNSGFSSNWTNRASLTYDYFDNVF